MFYQGHPFSKCFVTFSLHTFFSLSPVTFFIFILLCLLLGRLPGVGACERARGSAGDNSKVGMTSVVALVMVGGERRGSVLEKGLLMVARGVGLCWRGSW